MGFVIHKTKTKVPVENIATGRNRTVEQQTSWGIWMVWMSITNQTGILNGDLWNKQQNEGDWMIWNQILEGALYQWCISWWDAYSNTFDTLEPAWSNVNESRCGCWRDILAKWGQSLRDSGGMRIDHLLTRKNSTRKFDSRNVRKQTEKETTTNKQPYHLFQLWDFKVLSNSAKKMVLDLHPTIGHG